MASTLPVAEPSWSALSLGSRAFKERHGLAYAYAAGSMYRGISSIPMVVRMGRAGMLSFLGTGGMSLQVIEDAIRAIKAQLSAGQPFGLNLLADYDDPAAERATVDLYLKHEIRCIEAAAFTQVTPALVLYRARGLYRDAAGNVCCANRIVAKVSRQEVADAFMSPPPTPLLEALHRQGAITGEQAAMARSVPMSHDVCIEADSGGHTDGGNPIVLLPTLQQRRQSFVDRFKYREPICMGLGGGIGVPAAVAAAFVMGADFILTGSINQCTVESGTSDTVKNMLQEAGVHDTAYAIAGDMFELGARVQVLKKGSLFPMRANNLYALYSHYGSLEEIPGAMLARLERSCFKRSVTEVWEDALRYLRAQGRTRDIELAQANAKMRMARVFRWYFSYSTRIAFSGAADDLANYQVHTGPALGAFNQWVKGTALERWQARHVDAIALTLLEAAAQHLSGARAGAL